MTFREFQAKLSFRLLVWSLLSVTSGFLMLRRSQFWRQVGRQFIAWGLIDALIAIGGQFFSDRRLDATLQEAMPEQIRKDKRNLKIALWVNAGLDVLYIWGGLHWMKRDDDDSNRGSGFGVFMQGLFLLCFDIYHALKISQVDD